MISYYIIPNNVHYVQFIKQIETWTKTDKVRQNVPTVAVIEDSKATHYTRFVVIYKGMMQMQGGSGSCYNPCIPTFIYNNDPMDNSKIPAHMSKWRIYSYTELLKMVIAAKFHILQSMSYKKYDEKSDKPVDNRLPFWYWDCEHYNGIQGILIAQLDAVGLGKLPASAIKEIKRKPRLMLTS